MKYVRCQWIYLIYFALVTGETEKASSASAKVAFLTIFLTSLFYNAMYNAFLTSQTYSMHRAHWRDHKTHQIPHTLMNTRQHVVTVAFCHNSTKANHINDLQWQLLLYNALVQSKVQIIHTANYINAYKPNIATNNYIS